MKNWFLLSFTLFLSTLYGQGQKSPFHIGGQLQLGPSINKIQHFDSIQFNQAMGYGIDLDALIGYRFGEFIDFSIGGGLEYYAQRYTYQNTFFAIGYYGWETKADLSIRLPLKANPNSDFYFSLSGGLGYSDGDLFSISEAGFLFQALSARSWHGFINPGLGLIKNINGNYLYLGICYKRQITEMPLVDAQITGNATFSSAQFGGHYLGLDIRYDWHLPAKKRSFPTPSPSLPEEFEEREIICTKKQVVQRPFVDIYIWDHSAIDGDTISLELNGEVYLYAYEIIRKKKHLKLPLKEGKNILKLMAHNTGSTGENTCSVRIVSGFIRKTYTFLTNERRHEAMEIIYEP